MDPDFLHAINGDWDALLAAMRASRSLVHRADASGMSVLHWVCLHQDVPTDVVVKVVFANPHAARLRNDAGHLPLDLALQAECSERVLEILRAAHDSDADRDEPTADDDDDNDFGRSYFHDVRNGGFQQPGGNGNYAYNNHHTTPTSSSYHQQQQQLQQQYYHQQERQDTGGYGYESPQQQQPHHHHGNYFDEPHHQQHEQMVMYGDNSYRNYPEDDDDDDDRYTGRLQHQPHYANERLDERSRQRGRSHSSGAGINPMLLTEQRLQQREHDLISYVTDDPHADHHLLNPMFDPSANARRPPVLDAWQNKGASDAAAAAAGTGSAAKNFKPQQLQSSSFPPRWKQARHCHVCLTQFSFTKRRHHCRNCGQSVCGSHSTNRVALPKFALLDPQRLCDKCFLMGHFLVPAGGSGSFGVESLGSVPSSHHTATTTATAASTPYRPQPSYNSGR